jgi:hypothetical protein
MDTLKTPKTLKEYVCECCDFKCRNKKDYNRHLSTRKHKMIIEDKKVSPLDNQWICECGSSYKFSSGLSRHKKKCTFIIQAKESIPTNHYVEKENDKKEIAKLTEQVGILTTALSTAIKEGKLGNTTNNNTTNNTTNNQFNLNIFLKETCKDAMNIQDFVNQIKLQLSDLEMQGSKGYVEGISNIFIKNLDEMDEDKRPIHCTDTKREVLYVKNNDTWEKGETGRDQMKKAIDTISKNNIKQFGQWINENPQCKVAHTPKADQFHQISSEVAGSAKEKNVDKIIRKIAKGTTIDKS